MTAQQAGETRHARLPDGRRLGYCEYGDPAGRPVFFFHGWIGSRLDFAPNDGIARRIGVRVVSVDRPGCGASDVQPRRRLLDWPEDVAALADTLGIDRFGVCGHSFGAPYVAACAYRLPGRVAAAAIVAGIAPVRARGATRGMPGLVRAVLWAGVRAPALTRPYVSLMAAATRRPDLIRKGMASMLPPDERRLLDSDRFAGFQDHLGEMVRDGSEGAYWDARARDPRRDHPRSCDRRRVIGPAIRRARSGGSPGWRGSPRRAGRPGASRRQRRQPRHGVATAPGRSRRFVIALSSLGISAGLVAEGRDSNPRDPCVPTRFEGGHSSGASTAGVGRLMGV